jgi:CBS domain-containing protein
MESERIMLIEMVPSLQRTRGGTMIEKNGHADIVSLPVSTIMSRPVFTITGEVVLATALMAMVRTGRRHLAVVDARGLCIGVIGDRALAAAWASDPNALAVFSVHYLLDARPALVGVDATVGDVAQLMHVDAVDAVAVIDRTGAPVGMVTGSDLISLMATTVPVQLTTEPEDTQPAVEPQDS